MQCLKSKDSDDVCSLVIGGAKDKASLPLDIMMKTVNKLLPSGEDKTPWDSLELFVKLAHVFKCFTNTKNVGTFKF